DTKDCAVFRLSPAAARTGIKAGVDGAVGIQPRDAAARDGADTTATASGEISSDQNLAVRLQCNSRDSIVRTGIEADVERAVGIESPDMLACGCARSATAEGGESSTDYDLAIGLHRQRFHIAVRARIETIDSGLRSPFFCQQHDRHQ